MNVRRSWIRAPSRTSPSTSALCAPDPDLAASLRERLAGDAALTVVQAEAAERQDGRFDTAICFNVLEHVHRDTEALKTIRSALAPGGRLLLLVPAHPALYGNIDR